MFEDLPVTLSATAAALAVGSTLYTWITRDASTNSKALKEMTANVAELTRRIDHVETEMSHLPDKDTVHKLELSIAEMRGDMGQLSETTRSTQRTVQRIEKHLLETDK